MDAAAGPEVAASESLTSKWAELTAAAVAAAVATGSGQEQRMEEDIKALAESYARLFDDKDALVVLLAADAQESGEELRAAQEAHARQREALFAFHRAHVATLAEGFARDVGALQHEFQTEKAELVQQQGQEVAEVRQLLQAVDDYKLAKERERHQRHDRLHDVLTRQGQEQLAALRQTLSVQIDALTHNLRGKAPDVAAAVATETEVKALTSKDQALTNQIEAKMRKIDQELQRWKEWRVKMTTSGKEHSERNQSLFNEKRALLDQYRKLKVRLTHFRQEQQQALEALNEEVNAAQDTLHAQIEVRRTLLHRTLFLPLHSPSLTHTPCVRACHSLACGSCTWRSGHTRKKCSRRPRASSWTLPPKSSAAKRA